MEQDSSSVIFTLTEVAQLLGMRLHVLSYHKSKGHIKTSSWLGKSYVRAEDFNAFKIARDAGKFTKRSNGRKPKAQQS